MKKSDITILVADDDPDYLFQTVFNLKKEGYKTLATESQAEAEAVIARFKPDLAIFDLMMESDDSGFILCYKIKKKYFLLFRENNIFLNLNNSGDQKPREKTGRN